MFCCVCHFGLGGSTLFDGLATSRQLLLGLILWREDFAMLISCILLLNYIVPQILSHTGLIDSNSEVEAYLHKVLKDGVAGNNARNEEMSENARVGLFSQACRKYLGRRLACTLNQFSPLSFVTGWAKLHTLCSKQCLG